MKCLIIDDDKSCIDILETKLKAHFGNVELDIFQNHLISMNYKQSMIYFSWMCC